VLGYQLPIPAHMDSIWWGRFTSKFQFQYDMLSDMISACNPGLGNQNAPQRKCPLSQSLKEVSVGQGEVFSSEQVGDEYIYWSLVAFRRTTLLVQMVLFRVVQEYIYLVFKTLPPSICNLC